MQDWYDNGKPTVFWLPGFFFTPSFTTAALQNYARSNKLPIDSVGFDFQMMGTDPAAYTTPPESGIYIYGMFVEGCAWDRDKQVLQESRPKVLFEVRIRGCVLCSLIRTCAERFCAITAAGIGLCVHEATSTTPVNAAKSAATICHAACRLQLPNAGIIANSGARCRRRQ